MVIFSRKYSSLLLLLGLLSCSAKAQEVLFEYARSYPSDTFEIVQQWRCLGPTGHPGGRGSHVGNGQMNRLLPDPRFHKGTPATKGFGRIYGASPTGGLWRSEDEGESWSCITSVERQLPANNVAGITVSHQNPEILFIALGDGDHSFRYSFENYYGRVINPLFSAGIYRSMDEGKTWQQICGHTPWLYEQIFTTRGGAFVDLKIDPTDHNRLLVISSEGILRTTNALADPDEMQWESVLTSSEPFANGEGWRGLEFHPTQSSIVYASGKHIYRSTDGGAHWVPMTGPGTGLDLQAMYEELHDDGFCRSTARACAQKREVLCEQPLIPRHFQPHIINLEVSPADPDRLYAYMLASESYRDKSWTDCDTYGALKPVLHNYLYMWKEDRWELIYKGRDRGISYSRMGLAASPENPNHLYFGAVALKGTSPHTTLKELREGAIRNLAGSGTPGYHVDVHDIYVFPGDTLHTALIAHDGGFSKIESHPPGSQKLRFVNQGLQTNMLWTFDHFERPDSQLAAVIGTQDCGTYRLSGADTSWITLAGGDGYGAQIDDQSGMIFVSANYQLLRVNPYTGKRGLESANRARSEDVTDWRPYDLVRTKRKSWLPNTFRILNHPGTGEMIWGFSELYLRNRTVPPDHWKEHPDSLWHVLTDAGKLEEGIWRRRIYEFDLCEAQPRYLYLAHSGYPEYDSPARLFRTRPDVRCNPESFRKPELVCVEEIPMDTFWKAQSFLGDDFPIISGVAVHPENPHQVWITFTGYHPAYKVWCWTWDPIGQKGQWRNESSQSLLNLPVNGIVFQKGTQDRLYIATDAGVYVKDAGMEVWKKLPGVPNVRCTELRAHYCSGKLRVATFGRGLWEGPLLPYDHLGIKNEWKIREQLRWESPQALTRNLRIMQGGGLYLNAPLSMPHKGRLIVEPGGKLELGPNGSITNSCGLPWKGVQAAPRNFLDWLLGRRAFITGLENN